AEALHEIVDRAPFASAAQEPERPEPSQHLDRGVRPDAEDREERLGRSVAAQEHDPSTEWSERRARVESLPVAGRGSGRPLRTGERAEELNLPVALRAGDSDDLPTRDLEVDRAEAVALKSRDREEDVPSLVLFVSFRKRELERTSDHESDETLLR